MRRTTLVLNDDIFLKLKQESAKAGQSLKDYLNHLLRKSLFHKEKKSFKLKWKTIKGRAQPSISMEDRDQLYDFLDRNP